MDAKPATAASFVTPVVKDNQRLMLTRTMRRTDKLQDLMSFYHDMVSDSDLDLIRGKGVFLHRGRWIKGEETPEECGMKDGDEIQFFTSMLVTPVVVDTRGCKLTRTMRRTDRMRSLMDYYYDMVSDDGGAFLLNSCGTRVVGSQTPADIGLEDGDEIVYFGWL